MNIRFLAITTAALLLLWAQGATAQNLLSHWKFDETLGDTVMNEVGDVHGTNINEVAVGVPGVAGTAYEFDGTNGYIDANFNPVPPTDDFSAYLWMKSTVGNRVMMGVHHGQDDRWTIQSSSGGLLFFFHPDEREFSESVITDDEWHHVGVSRSGDTVTLWVDGVAEAMNSDFGGISLADETSFNLLFGGRLSGDTLGAPYSGLLDDVQIYDDVLSPSQVQFLVDHPGAVIPEPATAGILAICVMGGLSIGRRRR